MKKVAASVLGIISLFGSICYIQANDLNPSGPYMKVISETKEFNSSICESCKTINIFIKNAYMFLMDILNNHDTINHTKHSEYVPKITNPNISYELLLSSKARNEVGVTEAANGKNDNKGYTSDHQTEKSPLGEKETFEPVQVFQLTNDEGKQAVPQEQVLYRENDELSEVHGSELWSNNQMGVEHGKFELRDDKEMKAVRQSQAEQMKKYMNTSVNPCDDFYQFACGKWIVNPPPPGYDKFDMSMKMEQNVLRYMKRFLALPKSNDEHSAHTKAKNLYKACIDEETRNSRGATPLVKLLETFGGWPIINNTWDGSKFDWVVVSEQLNKYFNELGFIGFNVRHDKNSEEGKIHITTPDLAFDTNLYVKPSKNADKLENYGNFIVKIATLMGGSEDNVRKSAEEIVNFETKMANITISPNRTETPPIELNLVDVNKHFPDIDLKRFLSLTFNLPDNETWPVIIEKGHYFRQLGKLLNETDPRILANYMLWGIVKHLIKLLDGRFILELKKYQGNQVPLSIAFTEDICVNGVNGHMPFAMIDIMYRAYFDNNTETDIALLAKYIEEAFIEEISKTSWLGETARQLTRKKIYEMELTIEYSDKQFREKQLDNLYKDVDFQARTSFENYMTIFQSFITDMKKRLHEPNKPVNDYGANIFIMNAYYKYYLNTIILVIGFLQPPVYHKYLPKCINFGGLGNVIGHETAHGFTPEALKFDKTIKNKWQWDTATIESFNEKAQCFIEQYKNFSTKSGVKVEKVHSLTENIADSGGIKKAFLAYKTWLKSHNNSDETLPGMSYTPGQLFFLAFAQMMCQSINLHLYYIKLVYDRHAPSKYRITSTLQNSEDFANEFSCPTGSPMNPTTKCSI